MKKRYEIDVEREVLADTAQSVCASFMKLIPVDKLKDATEENTPALKCAFNAERIARKAYNCQSYEEVDKLEEELEKIRDVYDELL